MKRFERLFLVTEERKVTDQILEMIKTPGQESDIPLTEAIGEFKWCLTHGYSVEAKIIKGFLETIQPINELEEFYVKKYNEKLSEGNVH